MAEGRLAQDDRDALLLAMTDDVGALVLEDNRLQALALSIAEQGGAAAVPSTLRLIEGFEAAGRLDRQVEGLAANDELQRRAQDGQGLYRPELAVLLSTAKLALQDAIEVSPLAEDPALASDLAAAFPPAMRDRFGDAIAAHQLRREIVATKLANRIVNRLGIINPFELIEEEGCAPADMAGAFAVAERLFDMPDLWRALDSAAVPEGTRLALLAQAAVGMTSQMADILRVAAPGSSPAALVERLRPGVETLTQVLDNLLSDTVRQQWDQLAARLADGGSPAELTEAVTRLFKLDGVVGLADLAARQGGDVVDATRAFTRLGEALGLDWAQTLAARMSPADPWERLLVNSLARDFQQMRLDFLARLDAARLNAGTEAWLAEQAGRIAMFRSTVDRARTIANPNGAMLSHIAGQARNLLLR
jgi:glutamate dehydrogenase